MTAPAQSEPEGRSGQGLLMREWPAMLNVRQRDFFISNCNHHAHHVFPCVKAVLDQDLNTRKSQMQDTRYKKARARISWVSWVSIHETSRYILKGFSRNVHKMGLVGAVAVRCLSAKQLKTPTSSPTRDARASMYWNCNPRSVVPFRTLKMSFVPWTNFPFVCAVPRLASSCQDLSFSAPCPEGTIQQGQTCSPPARLEAVTH